MNKNFKKYFRPEEEGMDEIRRVLKEEGVYMCKGEGGFDVYHFHGCTILVDEKRLVFGAKLPITILHFSSQLEKIAGTNLEEIK